MPCRPRRRMGAQRVQTRSRKCSRSAGACRATHCRCVCVGVGVGVCVGVCVCVCVVQVCGTPDDMSLYMNPFILHRRWQRRGAEPCRARCACRAGSLPCAVGILSRRGGGVRGARWGHGHHTPKRERRWFVLKSPRCDTREKGGFIENTAMRHRRGGRSKRGERDVGLYQRERRWFVLERPRRDKNGGSETEVTVTSEQQAKAERANITVYVASRSF